MPAPTMPHNNHLPAFHLCFYTVYLHPKSECDLSRSCHTEHRPETVWHTHVFR